MEVSQRRDVNMQLMSLGHPVFPNNHELAALQSPPLLLHNFQLLQKNYELRKIENELVKAQLVKAHNQILLDSNTIRKLEAKVADLEDLVQKQKTTISNQSKTISDPKIRHDKWAVAQMPITPCHRAKSHDLFDSSFSDRTQQPRLFNVLPPDFGLQDKGALTPSSSAGTCSPFEGPQSVFDEKTIELSSRFKELWMKTELFSKAYGNEPNVCIDSKMNEDAKIYAMIVSTRDSASHLLNNPNTRPFHIAKTINFYLVDQVLRIASIKGFDMAIDTQICKIRQQLCSGRTRLWFLLSSHLAPSR